MKSMAVAVDAAAWGTDVAAGLKAARAVAVLARAASVSAALVLAAMDEGTAGVIACSTMAKSVCLSLR